MSDCGCEFTSQTAPERRSLRIALSLNATMFVVGLVAGVVAESTGLIADSLDMLADALAYAIGLVAINRSAFFKSRAATLSGTILLLLGIGVLVDVVRRWIFGASPESEIMLVVASLSLLVNSYVLHLLKRHKGGEVHLQATWIFTRADVIANLAVICSALFIWFTGWRYIDLIIGTGIGLYVIKEAFEILKNARSAHDNLPAAH